MLVCHVMPIMCLLYASFYNSDHTKDFFLLGPIQNYFATHETKNQRPIIRQFELYNPIFAA